MNQSWQSSANRVRGLERGDVFREVLHVLLTQHRSLSPHKRTLRTHCFICFVSSKATNDVVRVTARQLRTNTAAAIRAVARSASGVLASPGNAATSIAPAAQHHRNLRLLHKRLKKI